MISSALSSFPWDILIKPMLFGSLTLTLVLLGGCASQKDADAADTTTVVEEESMTTKIRHGARTSVRFAVRQVASQPVKVASVALQAGEAVEKEIGKKLSSDETASKEKETSLMTETSPTTN